jgi:hypothetical protein
MNERHFAEIEKLLLYVSDARERASQAAKSLERGGAEPHLITAARDAEDDLRALHRRLMQGTYFAVPGQDRLAV